MGKTKYSKAMHDKVCGLIAGGMPYREAAATVGIGERTFYDWKERYPQFAADIEKANGAFIATHLKNIAAAAPGAWQASAWLLERRHPDLFGRHRLDVGGEVGVNVVFEELDGNGSKPKRSKD